MKLLKCILPALMVCLLSVETSCQDKSKQKAKTVEGGTITLFDKELPDIKKYIDGEWELVSSKNDHEAGEYENTFITFNDDKYIWTEENKAEPGNLNWRKADTGNGYEAYLMDVFFETSPAYPLSIDGDTLYLQDCTETKYKYKLVRK